MKTVAQALEQANYKEPSSNIAELCDQVQMLAAENEQMLADSKPLSNGKEPDFDQWYSRMMSKLAVNADHFLDDMAKMSYVENQTEGDVAHHIASHMQIDHLNCYTSAEEIFDHLK
ncbi:hypothetical protein AJ79_10361 [Helicocarpus griseus UAMH5409]|uniref:Uncharacterized protein n=1 Tax=Helicocarpus griseus UAMH5409 TaxID=1447875 RepID=A0A2B7WEA1_9EURO|nr:hypothetical protein AJ79_10361 [Helicocarpus griseus UAMH5409]